VFIVSLMLIASLVSIEGWFHPGIMHDYYNGVISALFDNIPLTKMLIDQGGHDYGVLAFAVGVGGSITNFGSSAAIALWADFPEARKFGAWIPWGLLVLVIFTISYFGMVAIVDYHPTLEGVSEFAG